jgi:hypothetical protein
MTSSKIKAPYERWHEKTISLKHSLKENIHNELEVAEFIQNWTGEPCIVIHGL